MINEAKKVGLKFNEYNEERIISGRSFCKRIGDFFENDDGGSGYGIENRAGPRTSITNARRQASASLLTFLQKHSEKSLLHDELRFGSGWSTSHVCKKKAKNWLFSKVSGYNEESLGTGNYRYIPSGAMIHRSAILHMNADPEYRPPNLRISDTSDVVNKGDPITEYIIQEADDE
ncbi:hypothetical protein N7488_011177 [Penicillium malachiteum]|nr:hypothetical protein N7488_011177 [Penicillium malachiteum]